MTDRKPQPGPWAASEMTMDAASWAELNEGQDLTIVRTNWDGITGDVVAAVWCDDDHDEMATANLIAAAPDLRAALGRIIENTDYGVIHQRYVEAAQAALRKARGEAE